MLTKLRRRRGELSENFNKNIENITKNQSELKIAMTEMRTH